MASKSSSQYYPGCSLCKSSPFATTEQLINHWLDNCHQQRLRCVWGEEPVAKSNCIVVHTRSTVEKAWNVEKVQELFETSDGSGSGHVFSQLTNFLWWPDRRRTCIIEFKTWEDADDFYRRWINTVFVDAEGETVLFKQARFLNNLDWLALFPDAVADKLDGHSGWNAPNKSLEISNRKRSLEQDPCQTEMNANNKSEIPSKIRKSTSSSDGEKIENIMEADKNYTNFLCKSSAREREWDYIHSGFQQTPVELLEKLAKYRKWLFPEYSISLVGRRKKRARTATYLCKVLVNGVEWVDTIRASEKQAKCQIASKALKAILNEAELDAGGGGDDNLIAQQLIPVGPPQVSKSSKQSESRECQKPSHSTTTVQSQSDLPIISLGASEPHNSNQNFPESSVNRKPLEPSRNHQRPPKLGSNIQKPSNSTGRRPRKTRHPLEPPTRQIQNSAPTTTASKPANVPRTSRNSERCPVPAAIVNSTRTIRNQTLDSSSSSSPQCPLQRLENVAERRAWLPPQYFLTVIGKYGDKLTKRYKYFCTVLLNGVEWARDTVCATKLEAKRHIARKALQRILESTPATVVPGSSNLNSIQVVPAPLPPNDREGEDFWWDIESENWGDNVSPISSRSPSPSPPPQPQEELPPPNHNGTNSTKTVIKTEVPENCENWTNDNDQLFASGETLTELMESGLGQNQENPPPPL